MVLLRLGGGKAQGLKRSHCKQLMAALEIHNRDSKRHWCQIKVGEWRELGGQLSVASALSRPDHPSCLVSHPVLAAPSAPLLTTQQQPLDS
jgi:hypothetical protein